MKKACLFDNTTSVESSFSGSARLSERDAGRCVSPEPAEPWLKSRILRAAACLARRWRYAGWLIASLGFSGTANSQTEWNTPPFNADPAPYSWATQPFTAPPAGTPPTTVLVADGDGELIWKANGQSITGLTAATVVSEGTDTFLRILPVTPGGNPTNPPAQGHVVTCSWKPSDLLNPNHPAGGWYPCQNRRVFINFRMRVSQPDSWPCWCRFPQSGMRGRWRTRS